MTHTPISVDLRPLYVPLDSAVVAWETQGVIGSLVEDVIAASLMHHAYHEALGAMRSAKAPETGDDGIAYLYALRSPYGFAQAWLRILRDVAGGLIVLADTESTAEAARPAAAVFGKAFPGVATAEGPMRVSYAGEEEVHYAVGPGRFPVRIDDAAVRELEGVAVTLFEGLPKETPFKASA